MPAFWDISTSAAPTLDSELVRQTIGMGIENFVCDHCQNYKGSLSCKFGIFIAFKGANMSSCQHYMQGKECPYCGRIV